MPDDSCGAEIQEKRVQSNIVHHQQLGKVDELENAKAEMGEVKEENVRLKMMLQQIEKEYRSLQLRFFDILKREASKKPTDSPSAPDLIQETEEPELVSLCLGRSPSDQLIKKDIENSSRYVSKNLDDIEDHCLQANLTLGLGSKMQLSTELVSVPTTENGSEDVKGGEAAIKTSSKTMRNVSDDEISQQAHAKRARVSVRARCDTTTMNDGCQWRKYGQKISKGNPCPRAYYRCTVAPACPVRKQVQRCAEDMSILITTYEGTHNHPLPISATAMASTTSAAASMLLSASSTSQTPSVLNPTATAIAATSQLLNGITNFGVFNNLTRKSFYLPNHSSPLFPTVTLDLTSSSSSSQFNRLSSSFPLGPRIPSSNLSFCSSDPNILPPPGYLGYGSVPFDKKQSPQEYFYQAQHCMEKNSQASSAQEVFTESMTKAITSDPSFKSVIAAAISSMVGGSETQVAKQLGQRLTGEAVAKATFQNPLMSTQNGKGCASSYFNRLSSSNSQAGTLMMLQPPLPFSPSKTTSARAIGEQKL
ncbi:hypothetical protein FNV43_RR14454 [Rhamnella rubrinervis]|uniref:WRKY domain-containing protein n=1 Tax=Rhamnella rubrinervis TaxID=2594499 RepID=A0A8K0H2Y9_9ROSA|nr:hypothetical protein FNV43_RR14454 [Rhamnella rubrinervis]